ncbi:MAG TPA: divalent-cation tolerance protein CutA [Alphaproteobacteria bacterium]|nr:divalent-cation tolerance protein CutA [Alphaproteobacteria bacterium]
MGEHRLLYITVGNIDEARRIARALVEERIAACANIVAAMESIYWWEGKPTEDREIIVIAKTRTALVERAIARVRELHSYTVPCVVALPILDGNRGFLDWIDAETGAKR